MARTWLVRRGGFNASSSRRPLASTSVAMALARMVAGLASTPPQLPEWCPPSRRLTSRWIRIPPRQPREVGGRAAPMAGLVPTVGQVAIEVDRYPAAAAEEDGGAVGGKPRPVGCHKQIGLEFIAQLYADLAQIRRSDLLAGFN